MTTVLVTNIRLLGDPLDNNRLCLIGPCLSGHIYTIIMHTKLVVFIFVVYLFYATKGQTQVDGDWSPWEIDPQIDCCMYGGFERVRRYCSNPLPENGGAKCGDDKVDMEEKWRHCKCNCFPECDGITSFCANDTGKPAHCLCNWGWVRLAGYDPNDMAVCEKPKEKESKDETTARDELGCRTANADDKKVMNIIRYVTCGWVVGWMVFAIIIFLVFTVFTPLRIIHMQEEITVLITFALIGIVAEDAGSLSTCRLSSAALQYFYLAAVIFFCIEALHSFSLVTYIVSKGGFLHAIINLSIGYLVPLAVVGICLGVLWDEYGTSGCECFCNMDNRQPWAFFIPTFSLAFIGLIIAEAGGVGHYRKLPDAQPKAVNDAKVSERSVLVTLPLSAIAYTLALVAVHMENMVIYSFLATVNIFLGPIIFIYHTMADNTVREFIHKYIPPLPCYKPHDDKEEEFDQIQTKKKSSAVPMPGEEPKPSVHKPPGSSPEDDQFVKWVTDGRDTSDAAKESEQKLFNK